MVQTGIVAVYLKYNKSSFQFRRCIYVPLETYSIKHPSL